MASKLILGLNDLQSQNPSIAADWDYEKNGSLRPEMFTTGSDKKVFWIGACGHSWEATISSRNSGTGCPICARKSNAKKIRLTAVKKHGSLYDLNPELLLDWDYSKNVDFGPNEVTPQSHESVWWKCAKCEYEWQAVIRNRVKGRNCPNCITLQKRPKTIPRTAITLAIGNARIASEWHPTKNGLLTPEDVTVGSHKKVWWQCSKGHEWQATPNHRTSGGRNCPYCCANPQVLAGVNDLATKKPNLAKEWNYEKNGSLTPDQVTANSSRSVWWKCYLGHEWQTSVNHRSRGSGCPYCANGKQTSFPEQAIFYYVSKFYPDAINGYTDIFHNHGMELDIFIPSLKIGIEYDGIAFHKSKKQKEREAKKYTICKNEGIKLVRIRENINDLDDTSCDYLIMLTNGLAMAIQSLTNLGIHISNINIERDQNNIDASYRSLLKTNSLSSKYPKIAAEWDYSLNTPLTPEMFPAKSNRVVWWRCSLGHTWKAKLDSRVRGTGCPYCCNNKILNGFNDLATKRPDLIKEWDFDLNIDLDPTMISPGSGKKAWWKCQAGHSWKAEVSSRNKGHGCPYCAGNRVQDL